MVATLLEVKRADKVTMKWFFLIRCKAYQMSWSSGTRRCEVKKVSGNGTTTGGKGNGARDEVYEDEKVEVGSEVS